MVPLIFTGGFFSSAQITHALCRSERPTVLGVQIKHQLTPVVWEDWSGTLCQVDDTFSHSLNHAMALIERNSSKIQSARLAAASAISKEISDKARVALRLLQPPGLALCQALAKSIRQQQCPVQLYVQDEQPGSS